MKRFKTPRVSKDIVGHNHQPAIAEVLYTDTVETGDHKFPYAQVFVDRVSRYGDVIPLRSRREVGQAFVTFVCKHFVPLILISDNIAENQGGDLVEQCRLRDVKQLFTCPYHPQQDFAEGYIGRITTMASFGMVYSGAPLFMWIWAVKSAVFVDHIMASYYSLQKAWATPYELVHGELFPDASIVVPFGCGVLVLLTKKEQSKFKSRCALMLFVHYADSHPLYTYAVYSPRTRKVLMRQDCIFLTKLFPMRIARQMTGMGPNGEEFHPIRSPMGSQIVDPELSFADWSPDDPLPHYDDHVSKWKLSRPADSELISPSDHSESIAAVSGVGSEKGPHYPSHSAFGITSAVPVHPSGCGDSDMLQPEGPNMVSQAPVSADPELLALHQQLSDLKDRILARWVALLASSLSSGMLRVHHDDPEGAGDFDNMLSTEVPSSDRDALSREGSVMSSNLTQPVPSTTGDHSHSDSIESGEPDTQRRVSSRRPIPRIPFVGGSGGGLASRDHDQSLGKRPVNQRWFYDSTPASVPTLAFDPLRALKCSDHVTRHAFFQILNPPDSDDSEDSELTDEELVEAIIESTCINTVDLFGESAINMMVSQPGFTILRTGNGTALVLFPDRSFRVFFISEVDEAFHRLWSASKKPMPSPDSICSSSGIVGFISPADRNVHDEISISFSNGSRDGVSIGTNCTSSISDTSDLLFTGPVFGVHSGIPTFTPIFQFLRSDWEFSHPRDPFMITLDFPNALDPDNPLQMLKALRLEVFSNQIVPNLYLHISQLFGVFPWYIHLTILGKVLSHRGVITADQSQGSDQIPSDVCPVTPECCITVVMLCAEGLHIPPGSDGFPAGFPPSLPPGGALRSYLGENPPGDAMRSYVGDDGLNQDMFDTSQDNRFIYEDKYEAAISAVPPISDRISKMARFNAQERFNRRLWVTEMKAVWDFDQLTQTSSDSQLKDITPFQKDLDHASYLDYMQGKLTLYDEDYRSRAIAFKKDIDGHPVHRVLDDRDRARIDSEFLLRQSRTQELWKGLARLRKLRSHAFDPLLEPPTQSDGQQFKGLNDPSRKIFLTAKTIRRVLNFKENIMKYGVFVPRNDNEANESPEAFRWDSGRQLEWLRLRVQGTFERNWDWARVIKQFPNYKKVDIGHVFFVYDFKFSGEHRVRLVFDGSKQNPETYTETYAPTARGESVRLFHIFAVEETYTIAQYDVPQAFLKSPIDCDIFVYPPRDFSEFPGQLLKLRLSLYGAKQSAALWNAMIDGFLRELGFVPSPLDPCLYKRSDALIILFCDDLRVAATPEVLKEIHSKLYEKFQITTSDGTRFLGMDTIYDQKNGRLKIHMETYIQSIHERFHSFDISQGVPFREIVGCLLWVIMSLRHGY